MAGCEMVDGAAGGVEDEVEAVVGEEEEGGAVGRARGVRAFEAWERRRRVGLNDVMVVGVGVAGEEGLLSLTEPRAQLSPGQLVDLPKPELALANHL